MYVIVYYLCSVLKYAVFGSGPLTVLGGVEVGGNLYISLLGGVFILPNLFRAHCES